YLFFFSSRRRHTRSKRDWSSDVCSSDLCLAEFGNCLLLGILGLLHRALRLTELLGVILPRCLEQVSPLLHGQLVRMHHTEDQRAPHVVEAGFRGQPSLECLLPRGGQHVLLTGPGPLLPETQVPHV